MTRSTKTPEKRIMGTSSGATQLSDGRIEIAPMYIDEFKELGERELAAMKMHTAAQDYYIQELTRIIHTQNLLWRRIFLDLFQKEEIEPGWTMEGRYIIPPPPKQKDQKDHEEPGALEKASAGVEVRDDAG